MKEYDEVKHASLAVSQRSAWKHLISASKLTLIGPEGTQAARFKQEVMFVSDWLRQGGSGTFSRRPGFAPAHFISGSSAAALPKYLQRGNNSCVVALSVFAG